jgi:hypothetical protein
MRLGERILAELDSERTNNTLTRWLAHHLADLLTAAEQAKLTGTPEQAATADTRCRTAILDLWEHRSAWPNGWPPPGVQDWAQHIASIELALYPGRRGGLLTQLQRLHEQLLLAMIDIASSDHDTDIEAAWLNEFAEHLTPDEHTLLTRYADRDRRLLELLEIPQPDADTDASPAVHPALSLARIYYDTVRGAFDRRTAAAEMPEESDSEQGPAT